MPEVGERVGHYQIVRVLGRGGMGEVYEGWDETLERRVALKAILADHRLDDASRSRFLREARTLSQLDDPSICRIFDYVQGDDADLLVLELIEGRTLRAALREGLDFRTKLGIAEAMARALVAAHRAGVVHRDLKTENVMLTSSGGVKILDFGLARSVAKTEIGEEPGATGAADSSAATPDSDRAAAGNDRVSADDAERTMARHRPERMPSDVSGETAIGETVGTPMYMSPEQARGQAITAASDLYSFGLVLQELFTEKLPYPEWMTSHEVMHAAARGESLPATGIDRDVAALINNLKPLAPTDRLTALETVARIESIRDRTRRLVRRMLAAAAALVVVLSIFKYVVDVHSERDAAIAARSVAELRRTQADALIAFMIGDLRKKLEPVGKLDVLDEVGERALRYFASLRPEEIQARDLRRNAQTLSQLGEVRMAQGNLAGAEVALLRSLDLATAAAARDPSDAKAQLELGASQFWVGSLYRQKGDLTRALAYYTAYLETSESLFARDRSDLDSLLEVAYGHSNVGTILEQQGHLDSALDHYRKTVALKETRLRTEPSRPDWNADLATTVNKTAVVLEALGRFPEAEKDFQREHALLQSALAQKPDDRRWVQRLAANHSFLGALYEELGQNDVALEHYRKQHDIENGLVAHDPENATWQRNLATTDGKIARILRYGGRLGEAEERQQAGLTRLEPLVKKDSTRVGWRRDLASSRGALALLRLERGDVAGAQAQLRQASELLRELPDSERETQRVRWSVALTSGLVAARGGDAAAAQREWNSVADALWPSRTSLSDLRDLDALARALLYLGRRHDAGPILAKLSSCGYRIHDLAALSNDTGSLPHNRALAQKGS